MSEFPQSRYSMLQACARVEIMDATIGRIVHQRATQEHANFLWISPLISDQSNAQTRSPSSRGPAAGVRCAGAPFDNEMTDDRHRFPPPTNVLKTPRNHDRSSSANLFCRRFCIGCFNPSGRPANRWWLSSWNLGPRTRENLALSEASPSRVPFL
jgi:hypothetical protein